MAKSFDFNKIRQKTMNVTLSDKEKTTLVLITPDKKLATELETLKDMVEEIDTEDIEEVENYLYELTSKVMSRNKNGIEITVETLKELYSDISYIMAFLEAYIEFINEVTSSKN